MFGDNNKDGKPKKDKKVTDLMQITHIMTQWASKLVQLVILLICVWEMPGLNFSHET
jgi:hypothetical protein